MSDQVVIDLTLPLVDGMPVYPGDPPVGVQPAMSIAAGEGVNVSRLHMGTHAGTHVDAPFHVDDAGARLHEVPLERYIGRPCVIDLSTKGSDEAITQADMADLEDRVQPGDLVLLSTRWSERRGDAPDRAHPWLGDEAAEAIVSAGPAAVGIDAMSVDRTPTDTAEARLDAHTTLLGAGIVIVENLTRLHRIAELVDPVVVILPLALQGADGAPARAIAIERGGA